MIDYFLRMTFFLAVDFLVEDRFVFGDAVTAVAASPFVSLNHARKRVVSHVLITLAADTQPRRAVAIPYSAKSKSVG